MFSQQQPTIAARPRAASFSSGVGRGRPQPPLGPITFSAAEIPTLNQFLEDYLSWTELACFSNYENTYNKNHLINTNTAMIDLIQRDATFAANALQLQALNKLKHQNQLLLQPLVNIRHFGEEATFTTVGQAPQVIAAQAATPPIDHNSSRDTKVLLGNSSAGTPVYAQIAEKYIDVNNVKKFVSQSTLPSDIDKTPDHLLKWARTAVTSFLASAPSGTSKPNFEDGFSKAQLAALMSYCDFAGINFDVGPIQLIRMYCDELKTDATLQAISPPLVAAADWDKLKNNEVVTLTAAQQTSLLQAITRLNPNPIQALKLKLGTDYKSEADWNTWSGANKDPLIPSKGITELRTLNAALDALAIRHGAQPVTMPARSNNAASSLVGPQGMFPSSAATTSPLARLGGPVDNNSSAPVHRGRHNRTQSH